MTKYWDEYWTKFGFGDGDSMPPDAEVWWVYNMRIMNALLERHKSTCRVVCWERCGMHNPFLYLRVSVDVFNWLPKKCRDGRETVEDRFPGGAEDIDIDDAYEKAIDDALALEVYAPIETKTTADEKAVDVMCKSIVAGVDLDDEMALFGGPKKKAKKKK